MKALAKALIAVAISLCAASAWALEWHELSGSEQEALAHMQDRWSQIPQERQLKMQQRAQRWQHLSAEERQALTERMKNFRALPEHQRQALRERWKNMTPDEREAAKANKMRPHQDKQ